MNKEILFITGTRADFGKLKSLIQTVDQMKNFNYSLFVTGMHLLKRYGSTYHEIIDSGFENIHKYFNQHIGEPMEMILANTIHGLSRYIQDNRPDMIVIHGDRVEALAGAIVGSINNIRVIHIEGGERSGTIDELLRHSITKLSHIHLVANQEAKKRVLQLGESEESIFIIGSADIDYMNPDTLPSFNKVLSHYEIPFNEFGIVLYHPVTTEISQTSEHTQELVDALIQSNKNYIVIYPNNDSGTEEILTVYKKLLNNTKIRIFPSIRFEYFLVLLHHADFIIGNSSAGIREAPIFGVPSINIGSRQNNRFYGPSIFNCSNSKNEILNTIQKVLSHKGKFPQSYHFGNGQSADLFKKILKNPKIWNLPYQKKFNDLNVTTRSI